MRRAAHLALLVAGFACTGRSGSRAAQADSGAAMDVAVTDRLAVLRDSLARFPHGVRTPNWLWETGNLMRKRFSVIEASNPDAPFARQLPEEFVHSPSDAAYFYTGHHFRELVRRFPDHELADDAAYRLTDPGEGGECEGSVPCGIEYRHAFRTLNEFLRQYPRSPLVGDAVRRNDAFTSVLRGALDYPAGFAELGADGVLVLLTSYAETTGQLPDSLRQLATAAIAEARQLLDSLVLLQPRDEP